jgi:hypothetical protein
MFEGYCQYCDKKFTSERKRKFCCAECRNEAYRRKKHNYRQFISDEPTVKNTCPKDCKYIYPLRGDMMCNYLFVTGNVRGGDVTTCTVYEKRGLDESSFIDSDSRSVPTNRG